MKARSITLLVLAGALAAGVAWARPGGGGHYSGGGGGGFRGGGGGGGFSGGGYHGGGSYGGGGGGSLGGGELVFLVGIVIVIVVISAARRGMAGDNRTRAAFFTAQDEALTPMRRAASLDPLVARDPALTFASIDARVRRMNDVLIEAWCAGEMRPARPFVSDGVYSRFQVQLVLMRAEGLRNAMADAKVLYVTLEGVETAPPLDVVHVRFTARARDVDVPARASPADIDRELSHASVTEYSEIWSLVRRQGATTRRDAADVGRACPSCGAPIAVEGEMLKCRFCSALLCSAEHDWVLAEITQVSEWHPTLGDAASGLAAARARDPQIARQVLEDRASFLFWKWVQSARESSPTPIRKHATAEFIASRAHIERASRARDVAVGGADLVRVDLGEAGDMDRAYVKVYWSAAFGGGRPTPAQSVVRLVRKAGTASRASLTALACPSCGAPIGESDTPTCDHCGVALAAGDHDWVLDAIEPPGVLEAESRGRAAGHDGASRSPEGDVPAWLVPNVLDPRERSALFAHVAAILAADGIVGRRERRFLEMCARRWGIPPETMEACIARPAAANAIGSARPDWFLSGLVAAALVDGHIDRREQALLERACDAMRLPREELARQISTCRARLAREAAA